MTIQEFKLQKAIALSAVVDKLTLSNTYMVTEKIEGWWVGMVYEAASKRWHVPMSSAYKHIKAFEWVEEILQALPKFNSDHILIAEAYIPGNKFKVTNGLFNRSVGDYECKDVVFMCHDLVDLAHNDTARHRYNCLSDVFKMGYAPSICKLLPVLHTGYGDTSEWDRLFNAITSGGGEGIIIKQADSHYHYGKRNNTLIKLKSECVIDALAVGLEEGVGKKGNHSLTLIAKRKNGVVIRVLISAHKEKKLYMSAPNLIVGKVVSIKAMEEFENGSLRHPIFKCVREDKLLNDID